MSLQQMLLSVCSLAFYKLSSDLPKDNSMLQVCIGNIRPLGQKSSFPVNKTKVMREGMVLTLWKCSIVIQHLYSVDPSIHAVKKELIAI